MTRRTLTLTAIVAVSLGLRVWLAAAPVIPNRQPLADFPRRLGQWELTREESVPERLEGVLAADDYTLRAYQNAQGQSADLFVAYYKAQMAGESIHSPKNCLPSFGWDPIESGHVQLGTDGGGHPTWVNRYVVEKDGHRALVLYWYQVHGRVIASEYWEKIYLVWDALRRRRRDGALVRVTVFMTEPNEIGAPMAAALNLARSTLPDLPRFLPD